jgi:hypothetical protein
MRKQNMSKKIVDILGSVRFWIVTLIAVTSILQGSPVVDTIQVWLGAVAAIGTVDSFATKLSGK